jgi:phenylacetyl-CoA:acceptor oxidoreductase subunit 2
VGVPGAAPLAGLLALAFLFCQSRILRAARGIPAWRAPLAAPLIVATGLAEGGGLLFALGAGPTTGALPWLWAATVLARGVIWHAYRKALDAPATSRAQRALEPAGRALLIAGTAVPLAIVALTAALAPSATAAWLLGLAGLAVALTGAWVKHALVTRASFNQGFALARLPVRGVRP